KASDSGLAAKLPGLFFVVVVAVMYIGYLLIAFCLVWHHSRKLPPEGQLSVSDVVFLGLEADRTCAGLAWANGHVRVVYGSADAADGLSSRTIVRLSRLTVAAWEWKFQGSACRVLGPRR
ncbi:hypothetical protein FOZ63_007170, partial [Perkinsus olseni]